MNGNDLGNTRSKWLDALDRPWKTAATDGALWFKEYDVRGRVSAEQTPWGELRYTAYDRSNNPEETVVEMGAVRNMRASRHFRSTS